MDEDDPPNRMSGAASHVVCTDPVYTVPSSDCQTESDLEYVVTVPLTVSVSECVSHTMTKLARPQPIHCTQYPADRVFVVWHTACGMPYLCGCVEVITNQTQAAGQQTWAVPTGTLGYKLYPGLQSVSETWHIRLVVS